MNITSLRLFLAELGLRPVPLVIERLPNTETDIRLSNFLKSPGNEHHGHRLFKSTSRLGDLLDALRFHFEGGLPRFSVKFTHLVTYAVAYVIETNDTHPDNFPEGLEDDAEVVRRVVLEVRAELDSFILSRTRVEVLSS